MRNDLKPKQINVFYGCEEIEDGFDISMFNIYNYSTIATYINYNCKLKCCQNYNKKCFIIKLDSEFDVKISIQFICEFNVLICWGKCF